MKKFKILLILTIFMVLPIKAFALTGEVKLSCDKTNVKTGDTIACKVSGTVTETDDFATSLSAVINVSSGYEVTGFAPATSWEFNDISDGKIDVLTLSNTMTGTFDIGTLNIKVNGSSDGTLSLTSVKIGDKNSLANSIADSNTVNFTVISTLSSLTVTGGKLEQVDGFKPDVLQYSVRLDSTTTTFGLEGTPTNPNDTVTYTDSNGNTLDNSNIKFTLGDNDTMLIKINVGNSTYTILVVKDVELSNALSSLTVGGKTVQLIDGVDEYSVTLDAGVKQYEVKATLADPENFKISDENGGEGIYQISVTDVIITVEPKDASSGGSKRVYRINVKQSGGSSETVQTPGETTQTPSDNVEDNPGTSDISIFVIAMVLILSFGASMYFYKRNMENYN